MSMLFPKDWNIVHDSERICIFVYRSPIKNRCSVTDVKTHTLKMIGELQIIL